MDDLRESIKQALDELIQTRLRKTWPEHLTTLGITEDDAHTWGVEISQVVDEYRSTLMNLFDLLIEQDPEQIPRQIHSWAVGISEVTVPEIQEPMKYLEAQLEKHLPPEVNDTE